MLRPSKPPKHAFTRGPQQPGVLAHRQPLNRLAHLPWSSDMQILIEVSPGELLDKLTILEIKLENISDPSKLANVRREYDSLRTSVRSNIANTPEIAELAAQLKSVNLQLWRIEDEIRLQEKISDFGEGFVKLARSVYRTNDRRAAIKRHINDLLESRIVEEKSYTDY
jgi:hypothetical protein